MHPATSNYKAKKKEFLKYVKSEMNEHPRETSSFSRSKLKLEREFRFN